MQKEDACKGATRGIRGLNSPTHHAATPEVLRTEPSWTDPCTRMFKQSRRSADLPAASWLLSRQSLKQRAQMSRKVAGASG